MSLFDITPETGPAADDPKRPLAERLRPERLEDYVGQEHILGPGKPLRRQIETDTLGSIILWGPPGVGKTTLARLIARLTKCEFIPFSAVLSGIKEIKSVMADAEKFRRIGHRTIVFIDEIHRFNKAQQDAFLPYVERGDIILIGATTENPSFEVIAALLSRSKVYALRLLTVPEIVTLLKRGLRELRVEASGDLLEQIAIHANGDARAAYNTLEAAAAASPEGTLTAQSIEDSLQRKVLLYDKAGEEHFNLLSAYHKSLRGSDPQGALYWMARMLDGGEDPMTLFRRAIAMAAEDIGLADPNALIVAVAARDAFHMLGPPEGYLPLAEMTIYLATAPKSNSAKVALGAALAAAQETPAAPVPMHIRNAPTGLMKELGYGRGYRYAHDSPDAYLPQEYLPDSLRGAAFYVPGPFGHEKRVAERMEWWARKRAEAEGGEEPEEGGDE